MRLSPANGDLFTSVSLQIVSESSASTNGVVSMTGLSSVDTVVDNARFQDGTTHDDSTSTESFADGTITVTQSSSYTATINGVTTSSSDSFTDSYSAVGYGGFESVVVSTSVIAGVLRESFVTMTFNLDAVIQNLQLQFTSTSDPFNYPSFNAGLFGSAGGAVLDVLVDDWQDYNTLQLIIITTATLISFVDPTPLSDLAIAGVQVSAGKYKEAATTVALAAIPFAGDIARLGGKAALKVADKVGGPVGAIAAKINCGSSNKVIAAIGSALRGGCFVAGTKAWLSAVPGLRTDQVDSVMNSLLDGDVLNFADDAFGLFDDSFDSEAESTRRTAVLPRLLNRADGQQLQVPIEDVPLGARSTAENPRPWEYDDSLPEPNERDWVKLTYTTHRSDGAIIDVECIRPREFVEEAGLAPGVRFDVSIEELQVDGTAIVNSVEPCPPIAPGPGHVVISRFTTRRVDVLVRLELEGGEVLEGTESHPIWSIDRDDWTPMGSLENGEFLQGSDGPVRVNRSTTSPQAATVYNVEINGVHVYSVLANGILVHNAYVANSAKSTFELPKTWRSARGVSGTFSDGKHTFRIDTHNLSPGERFHVHIYNGRGKEIAVVQGSGTNGIWREAHRGETLLKPSEVSKSLRTDIRRLLRHALNNIE